MEDNSSNYMEGGYEDVDESYNNGGPQGDGTGDYGGYDDGGDGFGYDDEGGDGFGYDDEGNGGGYDDGGDYGNNGSGYSGGGNRGGGGGNRGAGGGNRGRGGGNWSRGGGGGYGNGGGSFGGGFGGGAGGFGGGAGGFGGGGFGGGGGGFGGGFDGGFGGGGNGGARFKARVNFRNQRYNDAYGDYRGGYGFPGGPRPQSFMGPGPMGPPGPPAIIWGRGFGPAGPPVQKTPPNDRAIRYLKRCGVTKDNLKNLPRELLNLIEPQYCGLCGHNFESFATSRLHYVSKNHLKSQKKWLNQQNELGMGNQRPKEIPLKSRDLYCELCDVHITSRTHADSHYAGKIHRAIVEGRKNPKNPFLLQRGMADRLEQLVRREKKHLKPIEETEVTQQEFNEAKPIQPELYCEICKTGVTCTEQMTMHLNGKRHLAKEKHYILKMMKGEGNDDKKKKAAEENEDEDAEEDEEQAEGEGDAEMTPAEGVEEKKDGEESFDWGNGSGTWDEPTPAAATE